MPTLLLCALGDVYTVAAKIRMVERTRWKPDELRPLLLGKRDELRMERIAPSYLVCPIRAASVRRARRRPSYATGRPSTA